MKIYKNKLFIQLLFILICFPYVPLSWAQTPEVEIFSFSKKVSNGYKYTFIVQNNSTTHFVEAVTIGDNSAVPKEYFTSDHREHWGPQLLFKPVGSKIISNSKFTPGLNSAPNTDWLPLIGTAPRTNLYWYRWSHKDIAPGIPPGENAKFSITIPRESKNTETTFVTIDLESNGETQQFVARAKTVHIDKIPPKDVDYAKVFKRPLKLFQSNPDDYWKHLKNLSTLALQCQEPADVAAFTEAIASYASNIENLKTFSVPIITQFVRQNPKCLLDGMISSRHDYILSYLLKTDLYDVEEMYGYLKPYLDEKPYDNLLKGYAKSYKRKMAKIAYEKMDAVSDKSESVWSVKQFLSEKNEKVVFVAATYVKGFESFQAELEAIWEKTEPNWINDQFGRPIKRIPLSTLAFMTKNQFGSYLLINHHEKGFDMVKAAVVDAALAQWDCGHVVSLLVLEPAQQPQWLYTQSEYGKSGVAIEFPNPVNLPEIAKVDEGMIRNIPHEQLQQYIERNDTIKDEELSYMKYAFHHLYWDESSTPHFMYIDSIDVLTGNHYGAIIELQEGTSLMPIGKKIKTSRDMGGRC